MMEISLPQHILSDINSTLYNFLDVVELTKSNSALAFEHRVLIVVDSVSMGSHK
jgi:hypothetical protein